MQPSQFWTRRSPRPQNGEIYGSYQVDDLIVETKFSMLYSSRSLNDGSKKAIKFIKCIKGKEERITNEIEIMKKMDHPNILKLEYSQRSDPYMIIITEYAPSGNLYQFINRHYPSGMPFDVALYVMKQMISAVSYLHKHGIWHRDIKPQNFLVFNTDKERPYIVLADFGLAKQYQLHETDNLIVGTKKYMAPELINNFTYTNAVDIWALGITFYYMLTNQEAFEASSSDSITKENEKIEKQIIKGALNYDLFEKRKIPQEMADLIKRMCEIIPGNRISAFELNKNQLFVNNEEKTISDSTEMNISKEYIDEIPCI